MGIYIYSAAVLRCFWLCGHMDCSPPGFSVHGDSPGTNIRVGCHVLLQGIFPSQGLNPGLPYCRQTLYQLSHQGSPSILEWVAYLFSRGFPDPGINQGSPALQVDSLPVELPGKSNVYTSIPIGFSWFSSAKYTFCLKYIFKIAAFSYENVHSFGYKV